MTHSNNSEYFEEMIAKAWHMAEKAHDGQARDKAPSVPYFTHCVEVYLLITVVGKIVNPVILAAGILHDSLEETPLTVAEIESQLGKEVLSLVQEVTRIEPSADQIQNLSKAQIYELRTRSLIAEIEFMSPNAQIIKLADRISNLRFGRWTRTPKNFARYCEQTQKILDTIAPETNFALHMELSAELKHCANNEIWQTN